MFDSGLRSPPRRTETTAYAREARKLPSREERGQRIAVHDRRAVRALRDRRHRQRVDALGLPVERGLREPDVGGLAPRRGARRLVSGGRGPASGRPRRHQRGRRLDLAVDLDATQVAERVAVHQPVAGTRSVRTTSAPSCVDRGAARDARRSARQRRLRGRSSCRTGDGDRNEEEDGAARRSQRTKRDRSRRRGRGRARARGRRRRSIDDPRARVVGPGEAESPRGRARGSCGAGARRCSRGSG